MKAVAAQMSSANPRDTRSAKALRPLPRQRGADLLTYCAACRKSKQKSSAVLPWQTGSLREKLADPRDRLLRIGKGAAYHKTAKALAEETWRIAMQTSSLLLVGSVLALGACTGLPPMPTAATPEPASNIPQEVRDIAAPFQDLNSAVLLEQDNCYWYEHQGPVETTLLPLRSVRGAPICAPAPEAVPAPVPAV